MAKTRASITGAVGLPSSASPKQLAKRKSPGNTRVKIATTKPCSSEIFPCTFVICALLFWAPNIADGERLSLSATSPHTFDVVKYEGIEDGNTDDTNSWCARTKCTKPWEQQTSYKQGFPTWVSPADRKLLRSRATGANIVVAQDGSGKYKTIKEAISEAERRSDSGRFMIYVKQGTYTENIQIGSKKSLRNLMLVGDGIGRTNITGSKRAGNGIGVKETATVGVDAFGFFARKISFMNTAGTKSQAVALRSTSHQSVFYKCSFEGYQDTLFVQSHTQFYRECDIYGTVDFIFGDATVVFQECNIYARLGPQRTNTITAQGRENPSNPTGIVIQNSRVMAASDLKPVQHSVRTYLGRPWRPYSRTVFMTTFLGDLIHPDGWMAWNKSNLNLDTLYYAEYKNKGPGAVTSRRVRWKGYHIIKQAKEASRFAPGNFINASSWLPATRVPFTPGL